MSKQPEVLRLVETPDPRRTWMWKDAVEKELRRQHALIDEMREVLQASRREHLGYPGALPTRLLKEIDSVLAKAEAQQ